MAGDLYIKYQTADTGARPIAPCTDFWNSPSVWLTDDKGAGIPEAKVGKVNVINVQVDSKSTAGKSNVKVQVWVCDYTLGGVGPAAVLLSGSAGSSSGMTKTVQTAVSSSAPGLVQVQWTPVEADLINSPEPDHGHVCVGANTYVEGTGSEGAIKTSGLLDVCNDQHHAWKNIAVIKTINLVEVEFGFRVVNPELFTEAAEFLVAVNELEGELAMGPLEQEQLLTAAFVDLHGGKEIEEVRPGCLDEPLERKRLRDGGRLVLTGMEEPIPLRPAPTPAGRVGVLSEQGGGPELKVAIAAGDRIPVTLRATLREEAKPGEVHTFDVTQTAGNGRVIGGARVVTVTVPAWFTG
jgi:hypothetical protein